MVKVGQQVTTYFTQRGNLKSNRPGPSRLSISLGYPSIRVLRPRLGIFIREDIEFGYSDTGERNLRLTSKVIRPAPRTDQQVDMRVKEAFKPTCRTRSIPRYSSVEHPSLPRPGSSDPNRRSIQGRKPSGSSSHCKPNLWLLVHILLL